MPTRNILSTLDPKQNDVKVCDVMNVSVGNSSNRIKVNATDDTLCAVNNNFVNTGNNEFLNTANKEFLVETKSPSQLNENHFNTSITNVHFIVICKTKNTDHMQ